jgi:hypothetical protein
MFPFKTNPFQRAEEVLMPAAHGTLVWLDGWPEVVLGVQKGLCDSQHGSCSCWETRPLMIGVEIVFLCVFWLCYCFVFLCIARQRAGVLTTCSFQFRLCDCHWLPQFEWNMAGENCWDKHCAHSCYIGVFCTQFYGFICARASCATTYHTSKALWQAIRGQSQYATCLSCNWPTVGFASFHMGLSENRVYSQL